jgi:hypothetical protein
MLDGMGVRRELAGAMLFVKTEKFSLAVVKWKLAGWIRAR